MKVSVVTFLLFLLITAPVSSQTGKPSSAAELASYTGADRERLLLEGAKREGKIVGYTTLAAEQNKQDCRKRWKDGTNCSRKSQGSERLHCLVQRSSCLSASNYPSKLAFHYV